ncbi:PREDICTED: protein NEN4-like [Ipomoea nil]|uniref:protein NEN4-like n=1 Tax=Ipomoea nil TaxID=35883 RepID=UPI000900CEBB|nr:PREDICTED: protein NEN4-like [Ipomoea nil]
MEGNGGGERASQIVFFDLETTVPNKTGQRFQVLEFGAMVICPRRLAELESFCTLIRPGDLSAVSERSGRPEGITRGAVSEAPPFEEVADRIFSIMDGRIWAGHNIQRFDCIRIKEAFAKIGRPAPAPVATIDSLGVLTHKFGRRAGNMKMATLAEYFGLGQQKHRSLDDVRMNLEVLKHCATVLFLEESLPDLLNGKWQQGSTQMMMTTRSRSVMERFPSSSLNERWQKSSSSSITTRSRKSPPTVTSLGGYQRAVPYARESLGRMSAGVRNLWCKAHKTRPFNTLLKHSHSLLR